MSAAYRQALADLYDLNTPELQSRYAELEALVDKVIEQCQAGWSVDVEQEMAEIAKRMDVKP